MRTLQIAVLSLTTLAAGQAPTVFTGVITDSECADAVHGRMRMGDTDPECVQACVDAHGATYVLFDGTVAYALSDQQAPKAHAGKKVRVTGTLDTKTKTITVRSIAAE